jgi:hypothetical protein
MAPNPTVVVGYASVSGSAGRANGPELNEQAECWLSKRDARLVAAELELDTSLRATHSPSPKDETTPPEEGEQWAR